MFAFIKSIVNTWEQSRNVKRTKKRKEAFMKYNKSSYLKLKQLSKYSTSCNDELLKKASVLNEENIHITFESKTLPHVKIDIISEIDSIYTIINEILDIFIDDEDENYAHKN